MSTLDLVRDCLDKPVVDRNGREMGRADSVLLELRPGEAPRVAAIEIGPAVLAGRLHPGLGRIASTVEDVLGVADGRPVRVEVRDVTVDDDKLTIDRAIGETGAANVENALRAFVRRLLGKGRGA
jgi:hypothetical protein